MTWPRALAIAALACLCARVGQTCCLAYDVDDPMSLVNERALIVWDADRGIEHFVRQAAFAGGARDFGFIVPAPSKPTVAEADVKVFRLLGALEPREQTGDASPAGGSEDPLVEQYNVGDYQVSILQAKDGLAILDWLKANAYDTRPAMQEWLDHYAKMGWFFAALKFVRPADAKNEETKAVRVTFKTDVPFYPYKMPTDTWPKGHQRPLELFFVASGVARANYRDNAGEWEADVAWSRGLSSGHLTTIAESLHLAFEDLPPNATVTMFRNRTNDVGYDHDLYFVTYTTLIPTWGLGLIALFVAGGVVYLVRLKKKPA